MQLTRRLARNRGFLIALLIAAWLGIEVGGKGTGVVQGLFGRGPVNPGLHRVDGASVKALPLSKAEAEVVKEQLRELGYETLNIYVCRELMRHYAAETAIPRDNPRETGPFDYPEPKERTLLGSRWLGSLLPEWVAGLGESTDAVAALWEAAKEFRIETMNHNKLCGVIRLPLVAGVRGKGELPPAVQLTRGIVEARYLDAKKKLEAAALSISLKLIGKDSRPREADIAGVRAIVADLVQQTSPWVAGQDLKPNGRAHIPHATGPDEFVLKQFHPDAYPKYEQFKQWPLRQ